MTNQAFSAILEHLCNEARNSMHATFGVMELLREVGPDSARGATLALGRASADQLLRSIDDVRDLLSTTARTPAMLEEFDLALCAGEIIEVLNLASGKQRRHMALDAPLQALLTTQDRKIVEQVLMRVLDTAFKLTQVNEVIVKLSPGSGENSVRLAIHARPADLAARLAKWLNADPDQTALRDPDNLPFEIAVMVAGKHLRALGGQAELECDCTGHSAVVLNLPLRAQGAGSEELAPAHPEARADALHILVAEDCDDNFALSELMLQSEKVWRAHDGREALRMIQRQRFDVVFMDVHMPGMDGYSAIRSIRDWETQSGNARTPMVVLSSDDLETQHRSAAQAGCSGFLRKPLAPNALTDLLFKLKEARMPAA